MADWPAPSPRILSRATIGAAVLVGALLVLIRMAQTALTLQARGPGQPFDAHAQLLIEISFWGAWLAVAMMALASIDRLNAPGAGGTTRRAIVTHVLVGVAALALQPALDSGLTIALDIPTRERTFAALFRRKALFNGMNNVQIYAAVVGAAYALRYYRVFRQRDHEARTLAGELASARLHALRAQLNPHFLFNSMNAIAVLARRGASDDIVRMVGGLSDLLRDALDDTKPHVVALRDEVDLTRKYLEIERIRFGDRLRFEIDVGPDAVDALVPSFLLQPLVENAIRHGVSRRASAGLVRISAEARDGELLVTVRDDGPGLSPEVTTGGVGIRNTRSRLQHLFGSAARVDVEDDSAGGAVTVVRMPLRRG